MKKMNEISAVRLIWILISLLCIFPLTAYPAAPVQAEVPVEGPGMEAHPSSMIVQEMLGKINRERAINDLKQLTGVLPIVVNHSSYTIKNRLTGSVGLKWAKEYVYQELSALGYAVALKSWTSSSRSDQNVIARKAGITHPEEEVYFIAHLDGVGSGENGYPAADDNASGVVNILELARVLSDYALSRTVVLFISTGEEQGALGVQSYLSQLSPVEIRAIKYAVNIDMVGYDANQDTVMEIWHGDGPSSIDLANLIRETIQNAPINLAPLVITGCG